MLLFKLHRNFSILQQLDVFMVYFTNWHLQLGYPEVILNHVASLP